MTCPLQCPVAKWVEACAHRAADHGEAPWTRRMAGRRRAARGLAAHLLLEATATLATTMRSGGTAPLCRSPCGR